MALSGYLYIFNLYHISILIDYSDIAQMKILLLPQISVDSPQKGFSGLQENISLRLCYFGTPVSTRLTGADSTAMYYLIPRASCSVFADSSRVWPHPEISGHLCCPGTAGAEWRSCVVAGVGDDKECGCASKL